eukprot:gene1861-1140_t
MGLLTVGGNPMRWGTDANNKALPHVSTHGIHQFLHVYQEKRHIDNCPFLWGEEIEHQLIYAHDNKVQLCVDAAERADNVAVWHPEYGSFMVESTPKEPYSLSPASLRYVAENIKRRYELIDLEAPPDTRGMTFVTFPMMGVGDFVKSDEKDSPYSKSLFVPDVCINQTHPRFVNLTENIRLRRGRKVCIQVPLFIDVNTVEKTVDKRLNIDAHPRNKDIDCTFTEEKKKKSSRFGADAEKQEELAEDPYSPLDARENDYPSEAKAVMTHLFTPATLYYYGQYFKNRRMSHVKQRFDACPCPVPSVSHPCVYMDCMAFGMGSNCLQVTMQLANESEARTIYDQMAVLCPPLLALSSATPFQKGLLVDSDVRWLTITASVDDRKRSEVPRIVKSRYDSASLFISRDVPNVDLFNDSHVEVNQACYDFLNQNGVDARLARHVAHLFIRDPLVMYDQMIDIDDTTHTEHFENIQSTNWQTVRFKIPPVDQPEIGWRVEFRVMDVQPTPFENTAFSIFIPLLTKAIIKYKALFYVRMSIVDENVGHAHYRDPCTSSRYVMRKDIFKPTLSVCDEETVELTIDEIFNGCDVYFGLIPLVRRFVEEEGLSSPEIDSYLKFLSMRAAGEIPTAAQYLRRFVLRHPDYQKDSRLSQKIAYDMTMHMSDIAAGAEDGRQLSSHAPIHLCVVTCFPFYVWCVVWCMLYLFSICLCYRTSVFLPLLIAIRAFLILFPSPCEWDPLFIYYYSCVIFLSKVYNSSGDRIKIIFFACDGVISPLSAALFSKPHMSRLKKLVAESGARLVLSCPWRASAYGKGEVSRQLESCGIPPLLDVTPQLENKPPSLEILAWLGANQTKLNIVNFVTISDGSLTEKAPHPKFFEKHAVQTRPVKGLLDEDVEMALKFLHDENNLSSDVILKEYQRLHD